MSDQADEERIVHGIEQTGCSNFPNPDHPTPWFRCLCGWESSPSNRWWEEVGEEYDDHLRMTKE